ncbi:permeases of the major facilitator superfamily [Candidatus Scalindua japonica]|uniref:Permeases of the major facilitator superfamily n=1 Tax=Candidatus Scalindua japonica TaxID=1284222 RepID=A0A286TUB3_9BACT|nr:hypothetical protein [Candidatus Scalindua japonica]GAX59477.1 permeases of the major facilitator superfamily [Candidatus Scalindua japonica]
MLQKKFKFKKLIKRNKPKTHASIDNVHGTRCILHVVNLTLFGVVIMLTIASVLIYCLMPVMDVSDLSTMVEVRKKEVVTATVPSDPESVDVGSKKEDVIENEAFNIITERNVFSHNRKEWVVKAVIPKRSEIKKKNLAKKEIAKKAMAKKKAMAGKPKKIVLHGIVIVGDIKKALINNPLKGVSKKKTMYVEEGEDLEGYKVTSIEKDRIRLDWHGEEIVVLLYSGLTDPEKAGSARKRKTGGVTKLDYKYNVVDGARTGKRVDGESRVVNKTAFADILEGLPINLMPVDTERSEKR